MIKLVDLHKSFRTQKVLDGLDLEIETGKTTVIIGRSGGGKSVLLKHIIGLILSLIGCYKGFNTRGGAEGVGRATTEAVVLASITILVSDYFLTAIMY
jgi:ABC-type transporter Mla maintaining outer membrane lipid asymmetry permease subunit MlaE